MLYWLRKMSFEVKEFEKLVLKPNASSLVNCPIGIYGSGYVMFECLICVIDTQQAFKCGDGSWNKLGKLGVRYEFIRGL